MNIKPLPKVPRLPSQLLEDNGASFIKALFSIFVEINATINALLAQLRGGEWIAPQLLNNWVNYADGTNPVGYHKDALDTIFLRGTVKGGAGAVFILPAGYRPTCLCIFAGMSSTNTACRIEVDSSGSVTWQGGGSSSLVSLDGISYKAAR